MDFEQAERKAAEEAERIRQLGYDQEREAEEERLRKEAEQAAKATSIKTAVTKSAPVVPTPNQPKGNPQDLERLGMGMKRLGFGGVPAAAATTTTKARYEYKFTRFFDL